MSDVKRWAVAVGVTDAIVLAAVGAFCLLSIAFHGEVHW